MSKLRMGNMILALEMGAIVFYYLNLLCDSVLACPTLIYPRYNFILLSRHFLSRKNESVLDVFLLDNCYSTGEEMALPK